MKLFAGYLLLFVLVCSTTSAQLARKYSFTHFTTANGLSTNAVHGVQQDRKGFLWIATLNGLQRYDGSRFLTFKKIEGDSTSLPNDNVTKAILDKTGRLWIMTGDHKIGIFNTSTHKYKEISVAWKTKKALGAKTLFEWDDKVMLFISDGGGFYIFSDSVNEFIPHEGIPVPRKWKLLFLHNDEEKNNFWLTCDSGIAVYNSASKQLNYRGHNPENNKAIEKLGHLVWTFCGFTFRNGDVFIGTWQPDEGGGLLHYLNSSTNKIRTYNLGLELKLGYHEINGRLEQRSGRVWFYGLPFLAEFLSPEKSFRIVRNEYTDAQSLKFDKITSLFEDRENNIWICTPNGLFLFNPDAQHFYTYNLLRPDGTGVVEGPVQTALQLKNGDVWIGCWGVGLYTYNKSFEPVNVPESLKKSQNNLSIWCMIQHSKTGKVYMGNQGGQLVVYDTLTKKAQFLNPAVFEGRTIRQITEDRNGNLWYGTQSGSVIKWDYKASGNDAGKGYARIAKTGRVSRMFTDTYGMIWVAGVAHSVIRIDPETNKILENIGATGDPGYKLSGDLPIDVIQYDDSLFVIASGPLDVLNIHTKKLRRISTAEGLPSNNVQCMARDNNGIIWIGMNYGLCRMNLEKGLFTFYDKRDGISSDNFSEGRIHKLNNGNIVLATDHNFSVFDPAKVLSTGHPPDVTLIDFKVSNRFLSIDSLNALENINLPYDNNSVELGFSALSYLKPNKIIYSYIMEGVDKDWIQANDRTEAIYTYLPPGGYTFMVKAENGDGLQSRNITSINIRIQPPFWRSWWFYGIIAFIVISIFYWVDRERVRRILALQQVRTQIATNLHTDVNTTLSNINLLSELARIKADKDISKSKEFIDQIHEKSRRMIDAMDDMLWSLQPENDYMFKTLERMTEYAQGIHKTYGIEIEMIVDENVKSLRIDMKSRHEIYIIFKEALNNIVHHSGASMALISIDLVKSKLMLSIQDNGKGFDHHSILNGMGLEVMKQRAETLKASLDVESDKKGTNIVLKVPIA